MDQIRIVIAELEVVLALLEAEKPNAARVKSALDQALADLREAAKTITGQNPGGGEA
jgi:hypothetical protein